MKRLLLTVASAALGIGMALPGQAQTTDAECQMMFGAADVNKDGSLGAGESDKFVTLMSTKPKDATIVTMEEFLAECRKDAFKTIQEAAAPAPDSNTAAKSGSDPASTTTTEQPASTASDSAATTEPSATAEQPAASSSTTVEQSTAATEQPAASSTTTEQSAVVEQPAATSTEQAAPEQSATAEQPATSTTTTEQSTATQPSTTDQTAAVEQPATTATPASDMLASKLIGTTVVSLDNQNIGEINDIVIDVENEQAAQAIIGVGGFLGIGEKNVAVELKRLNVRTDINTNSWTIVLDTTEDELKQLPEYKAAAN